MFLIGYASYIEFNNGCFNPYFIWTMFLIELIEKENLIYFSFNPYYNWTMFLIAINDWEEKDVQIVSILIITGQCFL